MQLPLLHFSACLYHLQEKRAQAVVSRCVFAYWLFRTLALQRSVFREKCSKFLTFIARSVGGIVCETNEHSRSEMTSNRQTDRHTHRPNYHNPRCESAPRVKNHIAGGTYARAAPQCTPIASSGGRMPDQQHRASVKPPYSNRAEPQHRAGVKPLTGACLLTHRGGTKLLGGRVSNPALFLTLVTDAVSQS